MPPPAAPPASRPREHHRRRRAHDMRDVTMTPLLLTVTGMPAASLGTGAPTGPRTSCQAPLRTLSGVVRRAPHQGDDHDTSVAAPLAVSARPADRGEISNPRPLPPGRVRSTSVFAPVSAPLASRAPLRRRENAISFGGTSRRGAQVNTTLAHSGPPRALTRSPRSVLRARRAT